MVVKNLGTVRSFQWRCRKCVLSKGLPLLLAAFFACSARAALAQEPDQVFSSGLNDLPGFSGAAHGIDAGTATIATPQDAALLISKTLKVKYPFLDMEAKDFYCIIHLVKWGPVVSETSDKISVERQKVGLQNWYVYNPGSKWGIADLNGARILGSSNVWLLFVHLDNTSGEYTPRYEVTVKKKQAANVAQLAELLKLVVPNLFGAPPTKDGWGGGRLDTKRRLPADITVSPKVAVDIRYNTEPRTRPVSQVSSLGDPKVFDNEGSYWWDVGVAVPIKRASELTKSDELIQPKKIDKDAVFGGFTFHWPPIDVKAGGLSAVPALFVGVDLSDSPFDRFLLAVAWGPAYANFYVGAANVRLDADEQGARNREWQPTFGVLVSVKALTAAVRK